jgi:hypothetical protein
MHFFSGLLERDSELVHVIADAARSRRVFRRDEMTCR